MLMLDLFSGLGGASKAMQERGWEIITVDNEPSFNPTILIDISQFHYEGKTPDLIWASPPCTDFSKRNMPKSWACNGGQHKEPDLFLMLHAKRIIDEINPDYWVIENVRGAVRYFKPYLGDYQKRVGSRYLWGKFPIFDCDPGYGKYQLFPSKDRAAKRSVIPYQISKALCFAIEQEHLSYLQIP